MSASPYYDNQIRRPLANVAASQTDAEVWPAESGKKLRVLSAFGITSAATSVTFNRKPAGVSGVAISPVYVSAAGVPTFDLPYNPHGWFETESGDSLTVTTGSGQTTAISLVVASIGDGLNGVLDEARSILLLENGQPLKLEN